MKKFIRIGIDLGRNHFQVHALTSEDGQASTGKLLLDGVGFEETAEMEIR